MSKKLTDLQVMQKMNENDAANGTETIGFCYDSKSATKVKGGAVIEMCMPESEFYKVMDGNRIPVLVLIDKKTFFDIKEGKSHNQ